jgi:hypothetical protein
MAASTRKFPGAIDSAYKVEVICMKIYVPLGFLHSDFGRRDLTRYTHAKWTFNNSTIDHRDDDGSWKDALADIERIINLNVVSNLTLETCQV